MRKEQSTNSLNERKLQQTCGMSYALGLIGGRWKPTILWRLTRTPVLRYSELRRSVADVSERVLVLQLRELEQDGLLRRTVYPVVPPRVEYELTDKGRSLRPVLEAITQWGEAQQARQDSPSKSREQAPAGAATTTLGATASPDEPSPDAESPTTNPAPS